jgi:hypothetical protein
MKNKRRKKKKKKLIYPKHPRKILQQRNVEVLVQFHIHQFLQINEKKVQIVQSDLKSKKTTPTTAPPSSSYKSPSAAKKNPQVLVADTANKNVSTGSGLRDTKLKTPVDPTSTSVTVPALSSNLKSTSISTPTPTTKEKSNPSSSRLFDRNPVGAREVNEIDASSNGNNNCPTPSTMAKVCDAFSRVYKFIVELF